MKNTVHFGFVAIILIMTLLVFVWLEQIKSSNETVMEMIDDRDTKIKLAHVMHDAIRDRQSLLLSMLITKDPFEIDAKIQNFYKVAFSYRQARKTLHALPMGKKEEKIHLLLDAQANNARPANNHAVEMFSEAHSKSETIKALHIAQKTQEELLLTLEKFVEYQRSRNEAAKAYSRKVFDDTEFWVSIFGLLSLIIAVFISRYVGKAVAEKNEQLLHAGNEMSEAYIKAETATIIKSEFLATMSHEIRTPLTAIIGFAETTLFSDQTLEQRQSAIQTIIHSGRHLLQIINDILDFSKVEANKLEIENIESPLFELLNDVEQLARIGAKEKGIDFTINYAFPLPILIKTDPLRLKQVLINLCNNAIKFTEKGHVFINVSCKKEKTINCLSLEVIDTGIGMTNEQMDVVFQSYRQADSSTTRKYGGTGLGLSLSKLLAEKLAGSLTVESEVNKGSKFTFLLEAQIPDESELVYDKDHIPKMHELTAAKEKVKFLSGHILFAEDDEYNQALLSIYLKRMGLDVTIVENGEMAVKAVKEADFDLILMDMRMPVMGGLEATRLLREQNFTKPIVALTANAMKEDRLACDKAGCNDFLTKPIDRAKLSKTLEMYLDTKAPDDIEKTPIVSSLLDKDSTAIDLIKRYSHGLKDTVVDIERAIKETDWEKLSQVLHQLKGTGGNFGYRELSSLAGKMEFQVANKNKDELFILLEQLKDTQKQIILGLK